jgi:hypothetical protein
MSKDGIALLNLFKIDRIHYSMLDVGCSMLTVRRRRIRCSLVFYFVAENLVLWARSETIGYAVNPAASGSGMMEYWNVGMLGLEEWELFL